MVAGRLPATQRKHGQRAREQRPGAEGAQTTAPVEVEVAGQAPLPQDETSPGNRAGKDVGVPEARQGPALEVLRLDLRTQSDALACLAQAHAQLDIFHGVPGLRAETPGESWIPVSHR